MFFVKIETAPGCSTRVEIHEDNVFTVCPECGDEHAVDIAEVFENGGDLYGTSVYCADCTIRKRRDHEQQA